MIEVRPTGAAAQLQAVPASSQGAVEAQELDGKKALKLTEDTVTDNASLAPKPSPKEDKQKVDVAVATINEYVQSVQRHIQFSVDSDLDQTVVKVVDADSGELIRQIPGEVFLEMARQLKENGELRLVDAMG